MPADGKGSALAPDAAVSCRDLVVRYGERTAVDRVTLDARRGEVVCILGPNGAGKTTTVECLEGYRRPASGGAAVLGLDPWRDHAALVGRVGVMLQRGGLYPMLPPRRALRLFASYYRAPEDPEGLLDLVRLRDVAGTPWRHLSGGEQARLSLALALVGRPEVVFLDEPTAGVDPEGRLAVRDVVRGLRTHDVCVVLTTHELTEAERLADRVVILHRGTVAAEGSPAALAAGDARGPNGTAGRTPRTDVVFGGPPGLDVAALGEAVGCPVVEETHGRYRVSAPGDGAAALAATLAAWLADRGLALFDLRVGRTLEEAYLSVVGTGEAARGDGGGERPPGGRRRARARRR